MKAIYENDVVRGAGYGLFRLEETQAHGEGAHYALVRAADHKSLHPGGWEDTEYRLTPDTVTTQGNVLYLAVGPDVVNRLDALSTYRLLFFPASGSPQKAILELSPIVYAPENEAGTIGLGRSSPLAEPQPVVIPKPAPEPLSLSSPREAAPARRSGISGRGLALGVVALVLCVGLGYFIKETFFSTDQAVVEARQGASAASAMSAIAPLDQARGFLRDNGGADEAFALASSLPDTPEGRDASFLLLEYAAEKGYAEAMLAVAKFYDPTDTSPKGSILPDAEQAWIWYGKAEKAGQAEGAAGRGTVRNWLESEASKGSEEARDLLLRLQ